MMKSVISYISTKPLWWLITQGIEW